MSNSLQLKAFIIILQWDILSHECATQDLAHFATGREASSRVSLVVVEVPNVRLA